MPKAQRKSFSLRSSAGRRIDLHRKILSEGSEVMRPCTNCTRVGETCVASRSSDKCARCVLQACPCDLVVSSEDWAKIDAEEERLNDLLAKRRKELSELLSDHQRRVSES